MLALALLQAGFARFPSRKEYQRHIDTSKAFSVHRTFNTVTMSIDIVPRERGDVFDEEVAQSVKESLRAADARRAMTLAIVTHMVEQERREVFAELGEECSNILPRSRGSSFVGTLRALGAPRISTLMLGIDTTAEHDSSGETGEDEGERIGLDALDYAAAEVRSAAAFIGPFHEQAAITWLDRSLSAGGTCTKQLRSALHDHDEIMTECVLRDDGVIDPSCALINSALTALQARLDARCNGLCVEEENDEGGFAPPSDARAWVDAVLLAEQPCAASLREQQAILFAECSIDGAIGEPQKRLQQAIMEYCQLVASVRMG